MADTKDAKQYRANLIDEQNSAALYRAVAAHEKNPKIADVYIKLAETEEKHAAIWQRGSVMPDQRCPRSAPQFARARSSGSPNVSVAPLVAPPIAEPQDRPLSRDDYKLLSLR